MRSALQLQNEHARCGNGNVGQKGQTIHQGCQRLPRAGLVAADGGAAVDLHQVMRHHLERRCGAVALHLRVVAHDVFRMTFQPELGILHKDMTFRFNELLFNEHEWAVLLLYISMHHQHQYHVVILSCIFYYCIV